MRVIGVDGCLGGWLAAVVEANEVEWRWLPDFREIASDEAQAVGVDIPIGLPTDGRRACDTAARALVGPRRSSVFPAPSRHVLEASSAAEARELLKARGGPSISAQAFALVRAIRQVDNVMHPELENRICEVHPEVSFARMTDGVLRRKRSAAGVAQRMNALSEWVPVMSSLTAVEGDAPLDDALDALAVAWSARRWHEGVAEVLGDGARDSRGLVMRIVV